MPNPAQRDRRDSSAEGQRYVFDPKNKKQESCQTDVTILKQYPRDDDIVMVDMADATPTRPPPLKRSSTSAKKSTGLSSMFGGVFAPKTLAEPVRPEPRRRNTYGATDDEGARRREETPMTDAEQEARRAARRSRPSESQSPFRAPRPSRARCRARTCTPPSAPRPSRGRAWPFRAWPRARP